jgi:hypothetical protein
VAFSCQRLAAFPLAASSCGPYPEQATSLYVLPYEVGTGHEMVHGNCTTPGTSLHRSIPETIGAQLLSYLYIDDLEHLP